MEVRTRWSALVVGAVYVGIGVLGWLRPDRAVDPMASGQLVVLGLWAATGILAVGVARPDLFQFTTREVGPWLALALAAPLAMLSLRGDEALSAAVPVLWPISLLPLGIALGGSSSQPDGMWLIASGLTALAIALGRPDSISCTGPIAVCM